MKQKTVLYLRTDIVNQPMIAGGSITHTLGVIKGFLELGYNVVCASSVMQDQLQKVGLTEFKELKNNLLISILRWRINCILSNITFVFQTFSLCKKYNIDFIYQRYGPFNLVGVILSKIYKIPLVLEYNGSEVWVDKYWSKKKVFSLRFVMKCIEDINIFNAKYIVVVSEPLRQELIGRGIDEKKILVNPNGVDTDSLDPEKLVPVRTEMRRKLSIDGKIVVGFVGTFSKWHGIEILASVMPRILQHRPDVHFMMIGDGPLLPFMQKELQKAGFPSSNVTFTGILPSLEAKKYLAACDIFVSPTVPNTDGTPFFGSPTKLFEYMSLAKPIVASDLGQIPIILQPAIKSADLKIDNPINILSSANGFLTVPGDAKDFENTLLHVLNLNPTIRLQMGKNARKHVAQNYSWIHHVTLINSFIEKGTY